MMRRSSSHLDWLLFSSLTFVVCFSVLDKKTKQSFSVPSIRLPFTEPLSIPHKAGSPIPEMDGISCNFCGGSSSDGVWDGTAAGSWSNSDELLPTSLSRGDNVCVAFCNGPGGSMTVRSSGIEEGAVVFVGGCTTTAGAHQLEVEGQLDATSIVLDQGALLTVNNGETNVDSLLIWSLGEAVILNEGIILTSGGGWVEGTITFSGTGGALDVSGSDFRMMDSSSLIVEEGAPARLAGSIETNGRVSLSSNLTLTGSSGGLAVGSGGKVVVLSASTLHTENGAFLEIGSGALLNAAREFRLEGKIVVRPSGGILVEGMMVLGASGQVVMGGSGSTLSVPGMMSWDGELVIGNGELTSGGMLKGDLRFTNLGRLIIGWKASEPSSKTGRLSLDGSVVFGVGSGLSMSLQTDRVEGLDASGDVEFEAGSLIEVGLNEMPEFDSSESETRLSILRTEGSVIGAGTASFEVKVHTSSASTKCQAGIHIDTSLSTGIDLVISHEACTPRALAPSVDWTMMAFWTVIGLGVVVFVLGLWAQYRLRNPPEPLLTYELAPPGPLIKLPMVKKTGDVLIPSPSLSSTLLSPKSDSSRELLLPLEGGEIPSIEDLVVKVVDDSEAAATEALADDVNDDDVDTQALQ